MIVCMTVVESRAAIAANARAAMCLTAVCTFLISTQQAWAPLGHNWGHRSLAMWGHTASNTCKRDISSSAGSTSWLSNSVTIKKIYINKTI